jgi:hypothetical protein
LITAFAAAAVALPFLVLPLDDEDEEMLPAGFPEVLVAVVPLPAPFVTGLLMLVVVVVVVVVVVDLAPVFLGVISYKSKMLLLMSVGGKMRGDDTWHVSSKEGKQKRAVHNKHTTRLLDTTRYREIPNDE